MKLKCHRNLSKLMLFHEDNGPVHKAVIAMAAIIDNCFELINYPPISTFKIEKIK